MIMPMKHLADDVLGRHDSAAKRS